MILKFTRTLEFHSRKTRVESSPKRKERSIEKRGSEAIPQARQGRTGRYRERAGQGQVLQTDDARAGPLAVDGDRRGGAKPQKLIAHRQLPSPLSTNAEPRSSIRRKAVPQCSREPPLNAEQPDRASSRSMRAMHSTWSVWGNMSTGWSLRTR